MLNSKEVSTLLLEKVTNGFVFLGLSNSFCHWSFLYTLRIIFPEDLEETLFKLHVNSFNFNLQNSAGCKSLTVKPFGIMSLIITFSRSYLIDEFLYLYLISASWFLSDNFSLMRSFTISVGGRRSPKDTGLKEIQKFAKSGNITTDNTIKIVGGLKTIADVKDILNAGADCVGTSNYHDIFQELKNN